MIEKFDRFFISLSHGRDERGPVFDNFKGWIFIVLNFKREHFRPKFTNIFQVATIFRSAAFIQLSGYIEKPFSGKERYQKAAPLYPCRRQLLSWTGLHNSWNEARVRVPLFEHPAPENYLSHVTVVQAWFRRNNLIWRDSVCVCVYIYSDWKLESWKYRSSRTIIRRNLIESITSNRIFKYKRDFRNCWPDEIFIKRS